jgi:hypothetical protein
MYRPGMFSATRSGAPLPEPAAAAAPVSNADWGAFGRRGGAASGGGNNSEHHAAFGRRQPREGRREERPAIPVRDYVPSNSLTAILDHALKGLEPKEEEWQTRLRKLQKKPAAAASIVTPRPEKPKPVDLSSEEMFPALGGAPAPKSTWAPKAQSFATLMKKHVDDEAEAARVEAERKAAEERARVEREREARRYGFMPARMYSGGGGGAGHHASYDDDEEEHNPEGDLDYQYNQGRRDYDDSHEMQAEAVEEEESVEDDEEHDGW